MIAGLAGKISERESHAIKVVATDTIQWLKNRTEATLEELDARKKEMLKVVEPIIEKLHQLASNMYQSFRLYQQ